MPKAYKKNTLKQATDLFFNTKASKELSFSSKQILEIEKAISYFFEENCNVHHRSFVYSKMHEFVRNDIEEFFIQRLLWLKKNKLKTNSLKRYYILYGKNGKALYQELCDFQSKKNTFEYKRDKYGYSKEDFDAYNKNRAVTKENLIKRHGVEKGTAKWNEYLERQRYTTSLDYFVENYGANKGLEKFNEHNRQKSHSYEVYLERYGDHDIAVQKLQEFFDNAPNSYSSLSQEFFWEIYNRLDENDKSNCYFAELNREFGKFDYLNHCYRKYDFCISSKKIIIEFNGNYYHGNPFLYGFDPTTEIHFQSNKKETLGDLWEKDFHKCMLANKLGFKVLYVWELDYNTSKEEVIQRSLDEIKGN